MANVLPLRRPDSEVSDGALISRASAGDASARATLFERHYPWALRLAARLGPRLDHEDVLQDAFIEALEGLSRLKDGQAFGAWLRTIVVRRTGAKLKRGRLLERLGFRPTGEVDFELLLGPGCDPELQTEMKQLYQRLDALPVELRTALVLRRAEGLELTELAAALGVSLATAKRRLTAAEERLAEVMRHG